MIAIANKRLAKPKIPPWHRRFHEMLPAIQRHAKISFHNLPVPTRDEMVQETLANCCVALHRLAKRRCLDRAYPSALARFAVGQARCGRRVGGHFNTRDILSPECRHKWGFAVETLGHPCDHDDSWHEALIDSRMPVDDLVAFRIDFRSWLDRLRPRNRRLAVFLALGHTTNAAARRFRLAASRISQLRGELSLDWRRFQGEDVPSMRLAAVA